MNNKDKNSRVVSHHTRILNESTPFAIKEAFNQLRTNLMYTANDGDGCPVFAITSAEESVGKSTITSNLSISYSNINKKVLLIDSDMRRPMVYRFFELNKKSTGLSELLSGIVEDDSQVIREVIPNLSVITSGCIPPNPAELISNIRLKVLGDI